MNDHLRNFRRASRPILRAKLPSYFLKPIYV
jgi:hypothetical protein